MMLPLRQTPVRFTATALLFAVLIGAPAAALAALDLTGTWVGTWKCKDVTSGAATKPQGTINGTVTQSGTNVNAFFIFNGVGGGVASYQGHVEELTAKPGQGATTLIACGTTAGSSIYAEALSANVKVSSSSATFKAVSVYEEAAVSRVGGTCKYSLKRTALADPGVAACPVPAVCGNGTVEPGENCDVGNLNGQTCATRPGFIGGTLRCGTGCTFDTSGCYATRFCDNGDGTVADNQTGLQWEQKDNLDGTPNPNDPHDADNTYAWSTSGTAPDGPAFTGFLGTLNNCVDNGALPPNGVTGGFAGHCDWRLPSIGELVGIVDFSAPGCNPSTGNCIDPVFGPTVAGFYWSATTLSIATDHQFDAWGLFRNAPSEEFKGADFSVLGVRSGSTSLLCAPVATTTTSTTSTTTTTIHATCTDLVKNGNETDVDCGGGGVCPTCPDGRMCLINSDCTSGTCSGGVCVPTTSTTTTTIPTCTDSVKNGNETDIDCGGGLPCVPCNDFRMCLINSDCTSGTCSGGVCVP